MTYWSVIISPFLKYGSNIGRFPVSISWINRRLAGNFLTVQWSRGVRWVRCTINRSHSTPCKKAEFEHLQIFPGRCLYFFLSVSGKICHSPIKKSEKTTYLDNLVFSASSVLWGTVEKSGLKSDPRQTLPGECAGESVTK